MNIFVKCVISLSGFHKWREAFDEVEYLASRHRHIFHITLWMPVSHEDREIEIIHFQNCVEQYLKRKYSKNGIECEFGNMSCEQIAVELLDKFGAKAVEVTEDGCGGALVAG